MEYKIILFRLFLNLFLLLVNVIFDDDDLVSWLFLCLILNVFWFWLNDLFFLIVGLEFDYISRCLDVG